MKTLYPKITAIALVLWVGVFLALPQIAVGFSQADTGTLSHAEQIIADTLASHQILCLSADGFIESVFLDGQWVAVHQVELVNRTLILRTAQGNLSLAAVVSVP